MKSEQTKIKRLVPLIVALVVLVVVMAVAVPTIARYVLNAKGEGGEHTPAEPSDPSINADADDNGMKNVSISVEDNGYPVYVRVVIIFTWQKPADGDDDDADVYYVQPKADVDYTLDLNTTDWKLIGNYYYCTNPVESGKTTAVLINSCERIPDGGADVPEGYELNVEIIVQTVQAVGATDNGDVPAWQDAWTNGPDSWWSQTSSLSVG